MYKDSYFSAIRFAELSMSLAKAISFGANLSSEETLTVGHAFLEWQNLF